MTTSASGASAEAAEADLARAGEFLQLLRDGRPRTRAELAQLTGMARSTVASRVDTLLSLGYVAPFGGASSTGGRPPSLFALNPQARVVVGADLGATHALVALADLGGTIVAEVRESLPIDRGPEEVLAWLSGAVTGLLADAGRPASDLAAIGIGLPGPVEFETGRPVSPPIMPGWDGFDVPGRLQRDFDVPVLVDNDVNIMALGERKTAWQDVDELMFVKVATGIGAGIIAGGRLQRGAQGTAGDLGHVRVPGGPDTPCACGNEGCLEAVASGPALARRLGVDVDSAAGGPEHKASKVIAQRLRDGDLETVRLVREAGRHLGSVLASCVSLINPSVIVVGGSVSQAGEHLLAGIREVVYTRSLPLATKHLRIVTSTAGARAGVLGAAALATDHALSPGAIEAAGRAPRRSA
ncbi:ROK family protein [Zafaria sp. J156]|uniref:ROK family transcriptional regulator n=3 Tax=Zafaria sp. J156 TaxID=3116490 RepID=UPI003D36C67C